LPTKTQHIRRLTTETDLPNTLPLTCRAKNTVKEVKKPVEVPTVWQVEAYPTFGGDSSVSAQPSTAISCDEG